MAKRGDVLVLARRLGFGDAGADERFVVLQHDRLNATLSSTVVAPLDTATAAYAGDPTAVPVSAVEAGTSAPQVLVITAVTCALWTSFRAGVAGRLELATLQRVGSVMRLVLDL